MVLSLSNFFIALPLLAAPLASAATVNLKFDVGWVNRNPDNLLERPVIGINGEWPLPVLNFTRGDRIVVDLHNSLGNQSTSLHFHGLFQNGTTHMDGPVGVTQCDVPPGSSFTYNFTVDQPGTYWYHSHSRGQYPDGLRGLFIVTDPKNPYFGQYDEEIPLTVSDWYHDQIPTLLQTFINPTNPTGAEPVPDAALMNDTQNLTIAVKPNKTYFFRLANIGAFAGQYFWIDGHNMTIIEVDGVFTQPATASLIYITAAQRYGFLVTTSNDTSANFALNSAMDTDLFDVTPPTLNTNVTGWLQYNASAPLPDPVVLDEYDQFDDFTLVPYDGEKLYENPDYSFALNLKMDNLGDGANYAFFNDVTYTTPVVPTLYSTLSAGNLANNATIYGSYTNSFVLEKGQVIELILNNDDAGKHPFHLHGHNFQVVVRADENYGDYDPTNHTDFPSVPARRDVLMVKPLSNFVIRWRADNPGVWFFHCHIKWHLDTGLAATMIEAPMHIAETLEAIPPNHFAACQAGNAPTKGNAAGNTVDLLDLTGQNESVPPLPDGFTTKGVVAIVFSGVAAVLGMAVIVWYGSAPLSSAELAAAKQYITEAGVSTQ